MFSRLYFANGKEYVNIINGDRILPDIQMHRLGFMILKENE